MEEERARCCRNCEFCNKNQQCTVLSVGELKLYGNNSVTPPLIPFTMIDTYRCKDHRFTDEGKKRLLNE